MIAAFAVSLLAVAAFAAALWKSDVVRVSQAAAGTAFSGLSAMVDSELDDDAKEIAVRRAAFSLIAAAVSIALRFALVLAAAVAPILMADAVGLVRFDAVSALMLRLDYIVGVSVAAIVIVAVVRRMRAAPVADEAGPGGYSPTEQFIHGIAFSGPTVQKAASWLDDRLVSRAIAAPIAPPIFVTSIARGGTTALLNALYDIPGVATHIYRDMPFITAPQLWNRLSGGAKRQVARKPRAHGDGLEIDLDTPEAFEEILWKMFWPAKYRGDGILLWGRDDRDPEANRFIVRHMEKIIAARLAAKGAPRPAQAVYCSKNNANIARIGYLADNFPGCRIVVPVRSPASHAASLWRQHRNFVKQQTDEPFVQRYMRDIGHFEFGLVHKPLMFPGFRIGAYDPASPDYWLDYWVHAFRHILAQQDQCLFVLQDDLRDTPDETMARLCDALQLAPGMSDFGRYFRSEADRTQTDVYDPALLAQANALYGEFAALARRQR